MNEFYLTEMSKDDDEEAQSLNKSTSSISLKKKDKNAASSAPKNPYAAI